MIFYFLLRTRTDFTIACDGGLTNITSDNMVSPPRCYANQSMAEALKRALAAGCEGSTLPAWPGEHDYAKWMASHPRVRILWYTPDSLEYSRCQNLGKSS